MGSLHKKTLEKLENASQVSDSEIEEVFNYWIEVHKKKRAKLDHSRRRNIGSAIHIYGLQTCKDAILGCSYSEWHMGRNKSNKKYNDIELILRDVEHVERFLEFLPDGDQDTVIDW
jgi:hypothetical protein